MMIQTSLVVVITADGDSTTSTSTQHLFAMIKDKLCKKQIKTFFKVNYFAGKKSTGATKVNEQPLRDSAFNYVYGLTISRAGIIYACDKYNECIHQINVHEETDTILALFPTKHLSNPLGVALNPAETKLYICNTNSNSVCELDLKSNNIKKLSPSLKQPWGITVKKTTGVLYIAEYEANNIVSIDPTTESKTVLAEGGKDGFKSPNYLTLSPDETELYFTWCNGVSKINLITNKCTLVAGDNASGYTNSKIGKDCRFSWPRGIAYLNHFLYVVDYGNNCVRKIDPVTGGTSTLWGAKDEGEIKNHGVRMNEALSIAFNEREQCFYVGDRTYLYKLE